MGGEEQHQHREHAAGSSSAKKNKRKKGKGGNNPKVGEPGGDHARREMEGEKGRVAETAAGGAEQQQGGGSSNSSSSHSINHRDGAARSPPHQRPQEQQQQQAASSARAVSNSNSEASSDRWVDDGGKKKRRKKRCRKEVDDAAAAAAAAAAPAPAPAQQSASLSATPPGDVEHVPPVERCSDHGGKKKKKSKRRRRKEAAAAAAPASASATAPTPTSSSSAAPPPRDAEQVPPVESRNRHQTKRPKEAREAGHNSSTNNDKMPISPVQTKGSLPPGGRNAAGRAAAAAAGSGSGAPRLSELQKRMRQKLEGAQFRMINETLYTSESGASLAKFKQEPELFDVYHRGFREQVEKWPVHPLDIIIDWLKKYPKARVADFGCGEARLAATVPNKVHSFDLVSPNPLVTACDMANVPIKDASVHVAVFCLSLMGTNLADFLREAHRVLVPGGLVKVAEVRSRFEGEEGGVERFLEVTKRLGFDTRQMDRSNKMFLLAEFKKSGRKPERGVEFEAKACIYKRR
ncbi:unnamed protein product [Ectocarpus sp. 12 AP-2014]